MENFKFVACFTLVALVAAVKFTNEASMTSQGFTYSYKIEVASVSRGSAASIGELQLFDACGSQIPPATLNAINGAGTTVYNTQNEGADKAVDGNTGNKNCFAYSGGSLIVQSPTRATKYKMLPGGNRWQQTPTSWTMSESTDHAATWTTGSSDSSMSTELAITAAPDPSLPAAGAISIVTTLPPTTTAPYTPAGNYLKLGQGPCTNSHITWGGTSWVKSCQLTAKNLQPALESECEAICSNDPDCTAFAAGVRKQGYGACKLYSPKAGTNFCSTLCTDKYNRAVASGGCDASGGCGMTSDAADSIDGSDTTVGQWKACYIKQR